MKEDLDEYPCASCGEMVDVEDYTLYDGLCFLCATEEHESQDDPITMNLNNGL